MRGHLKERSPGRWAIVLNAHDPNTGKRKPRWHSFKGTKREAQKECRPPDRGAADRRRGGAIPAHRSRVSRSMADPHEAIGRPAYP